jgi:copper(I)-binding protein
MFLKLMKESTFMLKIKPLSVLLSVVFAASAFAQTVTVSDPWIRATVAGQKATGAFMKITSKEGAKLTGVSSPAAGISEIHEMKMEKDVMKMAAIPSLNVPAGGAVELKPGSYHVMLMDLKSPLTDKSTVPVTLTFENAKGAPLKVELQVPVKSMNSMNSHSQHKH